MLCNCIVIKLLGKPWKWRSKRKISSFLVDVVASTQYNLSDKSVIWRGFCGWGRKRKPLGIICWSQTITGLAVVCVHAQHPNPINHSSDSWWGWLAPPFEYRRDFGRAWLLTWAALGQKTQSRRLGIGCGAVEGIGERLRIPRGAEKNLWWIGVPKEPSCS